MATDWDEYTQRLERASGSDIMQAAIFKGGLTGREILDLLAPPTYKVRYFLLWRITDKFRLGGFVSRTWAWRWMRGDDERTTD